MNPRPAFPPGKLRLLGSLFFALGGLLLLSIVLPWGLPNTYLPVLRDDLAPALDYAADGKWLEAAYFAGCAASLAAPAALGLTLWGLAVFAARPWARTTAAVLQTALLGLLAATAWIIFSINFADREVDPRLHRLLLGGGLFLGLCSVLQIAAAGLVSRKRLPPAAAFLLPPLVFFLISAGAAARLWKNTHWPIQGQLLAIAAGSALGLAGAILRLRSSRAQPNSKDA
ncbi:MAG: hypothetical protein HY717_21810 [Planctomycetes bacterium]|nr:hypothetical protein [Planctomycetota bacterium]